MLRLFRALFILALIGCKDSSGPDECGGIQVHGELSASGTGCGGFSGGYSTVSISVEMRPSYLDFTIPAGTGTYSIGSEADFVHGEFTFKQNDPAERTFILTAGTVEITSFSRRRITGALTGVTAQEPNTGSTISISGTFLVRCSPGGTIEAPINNCG